MQAKLCAEYHLDSPWASTNKSYAVRARGGGDRLLVRRGKRVEVRHSSTKWNRGWWSITVTMITAAFVTAGVGTCIVEMAHINSVEN